MMSGMKRVRIKSAPRIRPSTLRRWVLVGTASTTAAGAGLLITFAWLQSGMWVWQDGFYLTGDQWFNAARTTVTLVGIIGLGGAAFLAYRKQISTEATHLLDEATHRLEQSSGLRNRYTTGAEQLGHDSAAIRLAGVYALASLADDWHAFGNDDERQVCVDLLCAYLRTARPPLPRESAQPPKAGSRALAGHPRLRPTPPQPPSLSDGREEQHVRTAIINSIATRTLRTGPWADCLFNLTGANLRGASMSTANLPGANFREAQLTDAQLRGAVMPDVDLSGAILVYADMSEAHLVGAFLSDSNLSDADLSGARLTNADLSDAKLTSADLSEANLESATLIGVDLTDASLIGANLIKADLTGANLTRSLLVTANLTEADLTKANLEDTRMPAANLTRAILWEANLAGTFLPEANLTGAFLHDANLTDTRLSRANLTDASLHGANLTGTRLSKANLTGAILYGADLSEADLTDTSLRAIVYDSTTKWPADFIPPPSAA
ncbi:Type III effector pipB2 [Rhodococcus erythropolis]|nr:Type III effector pipB2 [Rhodococcus erythropolis]